MVMEKYGCGKFGSGGVLGIGVLNIVVIVLNVCGFGGNSVGGVVVGGGVLEVKDGEVRNDLGLMCVVFYWMDVVMRGGDEFVMSFLR